MSATMTVKKLARSLAAEAYGTYPSILQNVPTREKDAKRWSLTGSTQLDDFGQNQAPVSQLSSFSSPRSTSSEASPVSVSVPVPAPLQLRYSSPIYSYLAVRSLAVCSLLHAKFTTPLDKPNH